MRQYKWLEDDLSKVGFDPFGWNVKIWQSAMIEDGQKITEKSPRRWSNSSRELIVERDTQLNVDVGNLSKEKCPEREANGGTQPARARL